MSGGDRFPTTKLSLVLRTGSSDASVRRDAFEEIVLAYWKPVYKYVRLRWGAKPEDAEDLVQDFFAVAMEKGYFSKYSPAKARFRTYIQRCLHGFLAKEARDAKRQKRGGNVVHVPLNFETAEGEIVESNIAADFDANELFYQEWVRQILGLAAEDLRQKYEALGKHVQWSIFEKYDLQGSESARPTYQDLAREFDIPFSQVNNYLATARRDLREIILRRLREATNSEDEFRAEADRLFRVVIR